tara:strand:- start:2269 stop:2652 length:384 start_codon:yes stop_codon:yes gene_type:complete
MAKLKSKVVERAKKYETKKKLQKKRTLMGKGKGRGIKADKPLKKLDKSLRRIRKNPGGFAASVVDAGSVVAPASIARKGIKIVGKTDVGKRLLKDIERLMKKNPRKTAEVIMKRNKLANVPSSKKRK